MTVHDAIATTLNLLADVGIHNYSVVVLEKLFQGNEERLGGCDVTNRCILLSVKLLDDDRFLKIVRHEVAHALTDHEKEAHGPEFERALAELVPQQPSTMNREFRIELSE